MILLSLSLGLLQTILGAENELIREQLTFCVQIERHLASRPPESTGSWQVRAKLKQIVLPLSAGP